MQTSNYKFCIHVYTGSVFTFESRLLILLVYEYYLLAGRSLWKIENSLLVFHQFQNESYLMNVDHLFKTYYTTQYTQVFFWC